MDDSSNNLLQLRIDRPIIEQETEKEEETNSDSIAAAKAQAIYIFTLIRYDTSVINFNNENDSFEQAKSKKFSIAGLGNETDGKISPTILAHSSSFHRIQAVHPIVSTHSIHASPSVITFSTPMSVGPSQMPKLCSKAKNHFRNNVDRDSVRSYDRPRRSDSIRSDGGLVRFKSLVRKRKRDKKPIGLNDEEEEEEESHTLKPNENVVHHQEKPHVDWIKSKETRAGFVQYSCFLYALLAIVFFVVEEATDEIRKDPFPSRTIFHFYMYGVAIVFIFFVNLFVIHPAWFNRTLYYLADKGWWKNAESYIIMPAAHTAEPKSTLYLRMGTLLFGCAGVVLHGLELFLLFSGKVSTSFVGLSVAENIFGIVFTFSQMYFMNVNYKLLVQTSQNVCRFGFMHCFATNLFIWYKFAAAKTAKSKKKQITKEQAKLAANSSTVESNANILYGEMLKLKNTKDSSSSSSDSSEGSSKEFLKAKSTVGSEAADTASDVLTRVVDYLTTTLSPVKNISMSSSTYLITTTYTPTNSTMHEEPTVKSTVASLEHFGDFGSFLNTCLIEYSLIGAALDPSVPQHLHEQKRAVRVDFTGSLTGLYLGVVIFILGAVSCGVYSALYADGDANAYLLFGIYELVCYTCCMIAVVAAVVLPVILMRSLVLAGHRHGEDVDFLLLYVAFCGEVVRCSAELSRFIDVGGDGFIFAVNLVRLIHVFSQTWFILMACKLEMSSCTKFTAMRGRQCVTFMLVTNVTQFFFHIYESMTEGFGYVSASSSNHTYVKLMAGPLIAFYRFHCSVCLAEVWKRTFSHPKAHSHQLIEEAPHLTSPATSTISPMTESDGNALIKQSSVHHV